MPFYYLTLVCRTFDNISIKLSILQEIASLSGSVNILNNYKNFSLTKTACAEYANVYSVLTKNTTLVKRSNYIKL